MIQDLGSPCESGCQLSIQREEWFHGRMNRKVAENLLLHDGYFLVRESTTSIGQYVLSGLHDGHPKHLLLVDPEGKVYTSVFFSYKYRCKVKCCNKDRWRHTTLTSLRRQHANMRPLSGWSLAQSGLIFACNIVKQAVPRLRAFALCAPGTVTGG